jgi:hypothetical protein
VYYYSFMQTAALVISFLGDWCVLVFCAIDDVLSCYCCFSVFFSGWWYSSVLLFFTLAQGIKNKRCVRRNNSYYTYFNSVFKTITCALVGE